MPIRKVQKGRLFDSIKSRLFSKPAVKPEIKKSTARPINKTRPASAKSTLPKAVVSVPKKNEKKIHTAKKMKAEKLDISLPAAAPAAVVQPHPAPTEEKIRGKKSGSYSAKDITVLEGLEAVRKRPGMYIGSTGSVGLHHLVWEVVDNSIDEAMAGFCDQITVTLKPNHIIEVKDNGRGIPVDIHPTQKTSALEVVMTVLHAGGKFGNEGYKVSGGLHGVGVSVVNALSSYVKAEVHRDGKIWIQEYKNGGKPLKKTHAIGNCKDSGTTISFHPDEKIFETLNFEWKTIVDHLRQTAYLTKGVRLIIKDERPPEEKDMDKTALQFPNPAYQFYFEGGIASYVRHLNQNKGIKNETVFYVEKEHENVKVEIALQYSEEFTESLFAFTNNIFNIDGGTHVQGFRTALTRCLNTYARNKNILKEKDANLTGEDVREGLNAIISIKIRDPQFEGQTKGKLGNTEAKTAVETIMNEQFLIYLEEHPKDAEAIIGKCVLSARARNAAKIARDTILRKGALEGFTLPGKLADCSSRDAEISELYIVEGDSAGGCWVGNTKVTLADGRNISFKDLVKEYKKGKQNFCYTILDNGHINLAPILHPRITKKQAKVIKIILDTDEELMCTPDHLFRLTDGSYIPANQLTPAHSVAPLYKKISKKEGKYSLDGYEMVFDSKSRQWMYTHILADMYNLKNHIYTVLAGKHRHHVDFNKRNNNPTNIQRLPYEKHMQIHYDHIEHTLHRPDAIKRSIETKQTPQFREKARKKSLEKRDLFSHNAKKQWENEEYKKFMTQKFLEFYNSNTAYRERNNKLLDKMQREYWGVDKNRITQAKRVEKFFKKHPERKKWLSELSKKQWDNEALLQWRAKETSKQWTPEFRAQRRKAYAQTYLWHSLAFAKKLAERGLDIISAYNAERRSLPKRNNNIIKFETLLNRFFDGNQNQLVEAANNFNHKIKRIEKVAKKYDVYDIEVPNTHNFALASGVFVHNSAKQGRNRDNQAILPLRGKVLNVERARLDKILTNNELKSLIIALGTNIGEQFDITKLRYHRVIIMTDADVDGAHIRTLLLTFFYRYFPDLITQGHVYIAQPPLYGLKYGKELQYAYNDEEKEKILKELQTKKPESKPSKKDTASTGVIPAPAKGGSASGGKAEILAGEQEAIPEDESVETEALTIGGVKVNIQRYKGLGEMNPEQLWTTTMDPQNRVMKQVIVEDAELANETFEILMGDEVEPRKKFIQTYAKDVRNLDI